VVVSAFCHQFQASEDIECLSERAVSFLASHFFERGSSFIEGLPISTLSAILSHESLQLDNEHFVYEMICLRCQTNVE
jgi:hypothetical protein